MTAFVVGNKRVPDPPAIMMPFTFARPPDFPLPDTGPPYTQRAEKLPDEPGCPIHPENFSSPFLPFDQSCVPVGAVSPFGSAAVSSPGPALFASFSSPTWTFFIQLVYHHVQLFEQLVFSADDVRNIIKQRAEAYTGQRPSNTILSDLLRFKFSQAVILDHEEVLILYQSFFFPQGHLIN